MKDYICYVHTDSVDGNSIIYVNGKKMKISDYFHSLEDNFIYFDDFNKNFVKKVINGDKTFSINEKIKLNENYIKYVMKHEVEKELFELIVDGNKIILTEDHSLKVIRNNELITISPKNLKNTDKFINIV